MTMIEQCIVEVQSRCEEGGITACAPMADCCSQWIVQDARPEPEAG